ncbi:hypothetical protein G5C65_33190, partial [Streptomyces sp. SB3404]|nr:hypothetical protein [Streptomyces boncukensis]
MMTSRREHPTHSTGAPPAQSVPRPTLCERDDPCLDGLFTYCLSVMCEHDAAIHATGEALAIAERQRARGRAPADPGAQRAWLYALARWSCLRRLAEQKEKEREAREKAAKTKEAGREGRPGGAAPAAESAGGPAPTPAGPAGSASPVSPASPEGSAGKPAAPATASGAASGPAPGPGRGSAHGWAPSGSVRPREPGPHPGRPGVPGSGRAGVGGA